MAWSGVGGEGQVEGADGGHAERSADLHGGGRHAADVGRVVTGHGGSEMADQGAELETEPEPAGAKQDGQQQVAVLVGSRHPASPNAATQGTRMSPGTSALSARPVCRYWARVNSSA